MKFTIEELKLANELCFPADFERLLKKYLPAEDRDMAGYYRREFDLVLRCNLIHWIFQFSRADERKYWGAINEKIVSDLVNKD